MKQIINKKDHEIKAVIKLYCHIRKQKSLYVHVRTIRSYQRKILLQDLLENQEQHDTSPQPMTSFAVPNAHNAQYDTLRILTS